MAITNLYFNGDNSFVKRFGHLFPISKDNDGLPSREVPISMLALVATAVSHMFVTP